MPSKTPPRKHVAQTDAAMKREDDAPEAIGVIPEGISSSEFDRALVHRGVIASERMAVATEAMVAYNRTLTKIQWMIVIATLILAIAAIIDIILALLK